MTTRFKVRQRDALLIAAACIGVIAYVLIAIRAGGAGFPLDDSWIHQTYGRNLAQSGQWAFVPNVPSAGSTSPLYTVLLAIGYAVRAPYLIWAYALGAAALAACGLIGARLAEQLFPETPNVGLFTGLMIVGAWHLVWAAASGMETALFCTLGLAVIGFTWRETADTSIAAGVRPAVGRGAIVGVVGGLLTLARPEGAILVGLCGLLMLIARPQKTWREYGGWAFGVIIGWAITVAPDLLLNYHLNGSLLPNTSAAKQAENAPLLIPPIWERVITMLTPLSAGGQLVLIPGFIYALLELGRGARKDRRLLVYWIAPLWVITLIVLYAWRLPAPYQHGRYVIPALPAFILIGGTGTLMLAVNARRVVSQRVLTQVLTITAALLFALFWLLGGSTYARDVRQIEGDMVTAAQWIAQNVPVDAPLAVHDIGAVGYFAPRPLFDLAGLVSPEVVPIILDPAALMRAMQARGVRYMMASPPQLPTVSSDPRLCVLYTTPAPDSPIHMTVYKFAWNGICLPG